MSKVLGLILISLLPAQLPGAADWRGIVPLRSTRVEVERLLGPPQQGSSGVYLRESERISVTYAERQCDYGWQVPLGTVISLSVSPKNPLTLAEVKLDERKYEKRRDVHVETLYYYINQEEGINYTVDTGKGVVTNVEYYPAAKDNTPRCPAVKNPIALTKEASKTTELKVNKRGKRSKKSVRP